MQLVQKQRAATKHKATLLGATKQQDVTFTIHNDGISINELSKGSSPAHIIATIEFPYVYKIARAADSKGVKRILDITVQTKAGLQNLKVLLPSPAAVRFQPA